MAATASRTTVPQRVWPRWPYLTFLTILFLGPPVAALCIASGVPVLTWLGWLARDLLSTYVCPTPAKSYELFQAPMAVCTRCWGATVGLWVGWFLATQPRVPATVHSWFTLPVLLRLVTAALPFALWWGEIHFLPGASLEVLLFNGVLAGTTAGMFFCSVWPGVRHNT